MEVDKPKPSDGLDEDDERRYMKNREEGDEPWVGRNERKWETQNLSMLEPWLTHVVERNCFYKIEKTTMVYVLQKGGRELS